MKIMMYFYKEMIKLTILEYLYQRYECTDLDTLEMRCPVNINNLNLNNKMYKELEDLL